MLFFRLVYYYVICLFRMSSRTNFHKRPKQNQYVICDFKFIVSSDDVEC